MTKEYLKMADRFVGSASVVSGSRVIVDDSGYRVEMKDEDFATYAAHAINSHDEPVAEVERLRGTVDSLSERLSISRKQFQQIRLYTKDGGIACICADHESEIIDLLSMIDNK